MTFAPEITVEKKGLTNFVLEITTRCNFRCKYCCYSGDYKDYRTHSAKTLSFDQAKAVLAFIEANAVAEGPVFVSFFGGETLLELDLIECMAQRLLRVFGERVSFDISTNGWLLTPEVVERILAIPRAKVSVSVDGVQAVHDRNRRHASGASTFASVYSNLLAFKEKHPAEYARRIRVLLTLGGVDDIEAVDSHYPSFAAILGDSAPHLGKILPNFQKRITHFDTFESKLRFIKQAKEFRRKGASNLHTMLLEKFEKSVYPHLDASESSKCIVHTCLNAPEAVFVDIEGRLYPCEKMLPKYSIGHISTGFDTDKIKRLLLLHALRRNLLCAKCNYTRHCRRCLTDLNYTLGEQRQICLDHIETFKAMELCNE